MDQALDNMTANQGLGNDPLGLGADIASGDDDGDDGGDDSWDFEYVFTDEDTSANDGVGSDPFDIDPELDSTQAYLDLCPFLNGDELGSDGNQTQNNISPEEQTAQDLTKALFETAV